jgi:predicted house-cleaning noncanonical NTP pyrophosphatase (MazG superfamily)
MSEEYDKLVRDRIPEIIEKDGATPEYHHLEGADRYFALLDKLDEEVQEYKNSGDVEEIFDVLEVINALLEEHEMSWREVQLKRRVKRVNRGGFDDFVLLERVVDDE